jgi:hypothetical protein
MTKISQYALDSTISEKDKVLGTDFAGSGTKNFSVESLRDYFLEFVDGATTLSKTVTLTPAQLLSINGGGTIELLPEPETGKAYIVKAIYFYLDFNTTAYNFNTGLYLGSYDPDTITEAPRWANISTLYINSTTDITTFQGDIAGTVPVKGYPVYIYHPLVSVTQGDSTVKIKLEYQIIDLSL